MNIVICDKATVCPSKSCWHKQPHERMADRYCAADKCSKYHPMTAECVKATLEEVAIYRLKGGTISHDPYHWKLEPDNYDGSIWET